MIVCFDCPAPIKKVIDDLLSSGRYPDTTAVLVSAVENLRLLEQEVLAKGPIVIGDSSRSSQFVTSQPGRTTRIPRVFHLVGLTEMQGNTVEMPTDDWPPEQEVPLDRWMFGQYNRLLPAKASCRALANLLSKEPKGLLLRDAAARIAEEAALLGNILKQLDETNQIDRDDALSTGFPAIEPEWARSNSIRRYANQFVASITKGKVSGLLIGLKFINYSSEGELRIFLTKPGWHFALLPNPVLEEMQERPRQKFSAEETTFLLEHIARNVPAERFAYRAILTAINEGAYTPESLGAVLQEKYLPKKASGPYSRSFLSSQRSGAISRMADLGLVARIRSKKNVTYNLLKAGKEFLGKVGGSE